MYVMYIKGYKIEIIMKLNLNNMLKSFIFYICMYQCGNDENA